MKFIEESINSADDPKMFGLPENILFSWEISQSSKTINQMRNLLIESSGTQFSKDSWNTNLTPILSLWKRLNQGSSLHSMEVPAPKPSDDPIAELLSLEYVHAVKIMKSIHSTLTLISKSIKGVIVPDNKTVDLAQSLMTSQVPSQWDQIWSGPDDPVSYLETLVYKAKSTQTFAESPHSSSLLSGPVNLFKLFRPSALLNAFRQLVARNKKTTMDNLKFCNSWNKSSFQNESLTLAVSPLLIQGALFDGALRPVAANSGPFSSAPNLIITYLSTVSCLI